MPTSAARLTGLLVLLVLLGPLLLTACGAEGEKAEAPSATMAATEPGDGTEARQPPPVDVAWRGDASQILVSVWEMHCQGCEIEVEDLLAPIEGVTAVRANWETSEVRIELDDASSREAVIAAVRKAVQENGREILGEEGIGR